jgi:hypothetical protein
MSSRRRALFSLLAIAACDEGAGSLAPDAAAPARGLAFRDACKAGDRLVVAAVGDVLLHDGLARQAYAQGHHTLWGEVAPLVARAGQAYANLEGPSAAGITADWELVTDPGPVFDGVVYIVRAGVARGRFRGGVDG